MKLTIENNIPESKEKTIVIKLATILAEEKFSDMNDVLRKDCMLVRKDKGTIFGVKDIILYFQDWFEKIAERAELIVRWFPYNARPNILIRFPESSDEIILILLTKSNAIKEMALACDDYKYPPFFYNELPFNTDFIMANTNKDIAPLRDHLFCPECGLKSESLLWREGIIFQKRNEKKYGAISFFSFCENCNKVVEIFRDKSWNKILSMTYEQEQKALEKLTPQERSQYIEGTLGNKKPKKEFKLPSKTNEFGDFGKKFYNFLQHEIIENKKDPSLILDELNSLKTLEGCKMNIHKAGERDNSEILDDDLPF